MAPRRRATVVFFMGNLRDKKYMSFCLDFCWNWKERGEGSPPPQLQTSSQIATNLLLTNMMPPSSLSPLSLICICEFGLVLVLEFLRSSNFNSLPEMVSDSSLHNCTLGGKMFTCTLLLSGTQPLSMGGWANSSRIFQGHSTRKGCGSELEEANLQSHCQTRWLCTGLLQNSILSWSAWIG